MTDTPTTTVNEAQRLDLEAITDRLAQIEATEADLGAEKAGLLFRLKKLQGPTKRGPRKPGASSGPEPPTPLPLFPVMRDVMGPAPEPPTSPTPPNGSAPGDPATAGGESAAEVPAVKHREHRAKA